MAAPTPTSPTLNDLQYQSFTSNLPFGFTPKMIDGTVITENLVMNLVGYTGTLFASENTTVSENVVISPEAGGVGDLDTPIVSDTSTVIDPIIMDFVGFSFTVNVNETSAVTENVVKA